MKNKLEEITLRSNEWQKLCANLSDKETENEMKIQQLKYTLNNLIKSYDNEISVYYISYRILKMIYKRNKLKEYLNILIVKMNLKKN